MTALLLCVLLAQAELSKSLVPVQGDLSGGGAVGTTSEPSLALFIGAAWGPSRPPWGSPFGAIGFEMVYAFAPSPFRTSYGAQLRFGYEWAQDRGKVDVHPDVMLFAQVTPFAASDFGPGDQSVIGKPVTPRSGRVMAGVRAGLGITAPLWTRTCLFSGAFENERGFFGEMAQALTSLLLTPVGLLNHAELSVEVVDARPTVAALIFRVGAGF